MKKVLIITYYWPPASGPGVQRWLKFAKYLPEYDWEPIILTVQDGSYPAQDESLIDDIPSDLKVIKTKTLEPFTLYNALRGKKGKYVEIGTGVFTKKQSLIGRFSNYIRANYFIPDARIGWKPYAVKAAKEAIKEYNIDHVITTGPPHSAHLIGYELQKQLGIKWVADFRDPWVNIFYNRFLNRSKKTKAKDLALETSVVQSANRLIVVSQSMGNEFESRTKNITTITNGYDDEDISYLEDTPAPFKKFTLYYMGNFKASQSIPSVWKSLKNISDNNKEFANTFQMIFIGNQTTDLSTQIANIGISHLVKLEGFQNHETVIRKMKSSHMLFFPIPRVKENKIILTGKIFEYLASKLPMLSIGPVDGEASLVLKETNRQNMIDYDDQDQIESRILGAWKDWSINKLIPLHTNDLHQQFNRKDLTKKVADILDAL